MLGSDLALRLRAGNVGSGKPWSWAPQLGHYWRTGPDLGTKWEGRVVAQVRRNSRRFSSKHPRLLLSVVVVDPTHALLSSAGPKRGKNRPISLKSKYGIEDDLLY